MKDDKTIAFTRTVKYFFTMSVISKHQLVQITLGRYRCFLLLVADTFDIDCHILITVCLYKTFASFENLRK